MQVVALTITKVQRTAQTCEYNSKVISAKLSETKAAAKTSQAKTSQAKKRLQKIFPRDAECFRND